MTEDNNEYDPDTLEYMKRNNLWTGWAKYKYMPKPSRKETKDKIFQMIDDTISAETDKGKVICNLTKGALIRFVRQNFVGASAYKDVGKVASKIIKEEVSNRFGKWVKETKANYIRRRK